MQAPSDILQFIDAFLVQHADWLPDVTVDFALDLRTMVEAASETTLEVAA